MSNVAVGLPVRVRGDAYLVVKVERLDHLGSRWFGRRRFTVKDSDGKLWYCSGKVLSGNAKLYPES